MKEIAIIGSPNCGKTTLFNRLTGTRQRTGNWPGVTVERKDGQLMLAHQTARLVDLPGIYGLHDIAISLDAKVAHDYLADHQCDLVVLVLDVTQLPRQLQLLAQLQALNLPIIIAANMMDAARRDSVHIDLPQLEEITGIPVVGISAANNEGMDALTQALEVQLSLPTEQVVARQNATAIAACDDIAQQVFTASSKRTITEQIDHWLLHPVLAFPFFLLVMYLLFSISVNVGSVFIDFFDVWLGSWVIEGSRWLLTSAGSPEWLTAIVSDGLGGGIQLVSTFIPVIGCLYLCMSALEDSGYLSRAAFVIDGLMARIGLPGQAFIPLIVGFGCNVPSVMASRALDRPSARLTTIFVAPFMSCGARLSVYVFVGTALFPNQAQNAIFLLYLLGIGVAIFSAWLLRKSLFQGESNHCITEMPAYHMPLLRNVLIQTWQRLTSFMFRAGKRILAVVMVLSVVSSVGTDGSWGNQDNEKSVLAATGKVLTPVFEPIGIGENNWPATVGLFTGLFAKEVVVGTLDTLYNPVTETAENDNAMPDFAAGFTEAVGTIGDNFAGLSDTLTDPLGINSGDLSDIDAAAQDQGVNRESYDTMIALFPSAWAAFCFLAFILLYAPCVATIGVMQKEAGSGWLQFSVMWSLLLSYWLASNLWHLSMLLSNPLDTLIWFTASTAILVLAYKLIVRRVKRQYADQIPAINI